VRLSSVLSEARRDIATGTTRLGTLAALLALTSGLAGAADLAAVSALTRDAVGYVASGAATRTAALEGGVDGTACDALMGHGDVLAAGALRPGPAVTLDSLPGSSLPTFEITPGLAGLVAESDGRAGAWLAPGLAERLGAAAGDDLGTADGPLHIAGVFTHPDDGRDSRLSSAVLLPGDSAEPFDECWARAWPQSEATDALLRSTASSTAGSASSLSMGQLNATLGSVSPSVADHGRRLTRWAPAMSASLAALLGVASVRRRRLELSGARQAGQSRSAQLAVIVVETSAWAVCGALIAVGIAAAPLLSGSGSLIDAPARLLVAAPTAGATSAILAAALTTLSIRRRDLVRWFKDR
jgi:hypothetical protein